MRGAEGVHDEHVAQRGVLASTAPRRPCPRRRSCGSSRAARAARAARRRRRGSRAPAARRARAVPTGARRPAPANRLRSTCPSFGRPRCDVTITAAPCSSARRIVGSAAVMRCSDVIWPSFDRHVEVLADQHALAGQVEVGHAEDGHGVPGGAVQPCIVPPGPGHGQTTRTSAVCRDGSGRRDCTPLGRGMPLPAAPAHRLPSRFPGEIRDVHAVQAPPRRTLWWLLVLAVARLLLHVVLNRHYGFHRDELRGARRRAPTSPGATSPIRR